MSSNPNAIIVFCSEAETMTASYRKHPLHRDYHTRHIKHTATAQHHCTIWHFHFSRWTVLFGRCAFPLLSLSPLLPLSPLRLLSPWMYLISLSFAPRAKMKNPLHRSCLPHIGYLKVLTSRLLVVLCDFNANC